MRALRHQTSSDVTRNLARSVTKATNWWPSVSTCRRRVRYAPNHYGTCSGRRRPSNVVDVGSRVFEKNHFFYFFFNAFHLLFNVLTVHKEHLDKREEIIAPCKVHYDPNTAKEMLLLASTLEEQQQWISRLSKKIQKFGYKANSLGGGDGARVSPR